MTNVTPKMVEAAARAMWSAFKPLLFPNFDLDFWRLKAQAALLAAKAVEQPSTVANDAAVARCLDCGRAYGSEHGFPDLIVPDAVWEKINPDKNGGGLLCPSCMCKRAQQAGISGVAAKFTSGPFANDAAVAQEVRALKDALVRLLPYVINDSPGGCTGEYADCSHCEAIRQAQAALSTSPPPPSWRPIKDHPHDGAFRFYGLHIYNNQGFSWFEAYYLSLNDGGQMIYQNGDIFTDFEFDDFEVWCDAPPPPTAEGGER